MRTKGIPRPSDAYRLEQLLDGQPPHEGVVLTVEHMNCSTLQTLQQSINQQQQQQQQGSLQDSDILSSFAVQVQWLPDASGQLRPYTVVPDWLDSDDEDSSQLQLSCTSLMQQLQQLHCQQAWQQPSLEQPTKQPDMQQQHDKHVIQQQCEDKQQEHDQEKPLQQQPQQQQQHPALFRAAATAAAAAAAAAAWPATGKGGGSSCCEMCGISHSLSWSKTAIGRIFKLTCSRCTQHYKATGKQRVLQKGLMRDGSDSSSSVALLSPPAAAMTAALAAAGGALSAAAAGKAAALPAVDEAGKESSYSQLDAAAALAGKASCCNCCSSVTPYSWKTLQRLPAAAGSMPQQQQQSAEQHDLQQDSLLLCDSCHQHQHLVGRPRPVSAAAKAAAQLATQQLLAAHAGLLCQRQQQLQVFDQQQQRLQLRRERAQQRRQKKRQQQQQQPEGVVVPEAAAAAVTVTAGVKRHRGISGPAGDSSAAQPTKMARKPAAAAAAHGKPPKAAIAGSTAPSSAAASQQLSNTKQQANGMLNGRSSSSSTGSGSSSGSRAAGAKPHGVAKLPTGFKQLKRNQYVFRQRAVVNPDDVAVCQCQPSKGQCCREADGCLNRLLKVCCSPGSCRAGDACQNETLTLRRLPPLRVVPVGPKGYGVVTQQDISPGTLVAEYLGEVVPVAEGRKRLVGYAAAGLRHTYLMDLSKAEVIDATVKGGVARFINHSCQPNCETQKWQDGGELVIAIVAKQHIPAGTEVTYDYRYQSHVLPHARTRCCCGAASCRGWLGSLDPHAHLQAQLEQHEREAAKRVLCQIDAVTGEEYRVDDLDPMDSEQEEEGQGAE